MAKDTFAELVAWSLPRPASGSNHRLKYRLTLIVRGECVLRYDNEEGKGDHRHFGSKESPYAFRDYETLLVDFWTDVEKWSQRR